MKHRVTVAVPALDVIIVTGICFGWFILASVQAVAAGFPARPFDDSSFIGLIAFEAALGATAVVYLRLRGHSIAPLVPVPTAVGSLAGLILYGAAVLVIWPLQLMFQPSAPTTQPIEAMVAGATISLPPLVAMSVVNGLYEEAFLVGYLQRALERSGSSFAIGTSLLVRVLYHLYQGPVGAVSVFGFGLVVSVYFARTQKLWPVVFAHIFMDIAAFSLG